MTLTSKMIDQMRLYWSIDEHLEKMLLNRLGTEPHPHVYTEQDLHEQSRKMIMRYNENLARTPKSRIKSGLIGNTESTKKSGGNMLRKLT